MTELITVAIGLACVLQGPLADAAKSAVSDTAKKIGTHFAQEALARAAGSFGLATNHDAEKAIRRAQMAALTYILNEYDPSDDGWDFVTVALDFAKQAMKRCDSHSLELKEEVISELERSLNVALSSIQTSSIKDRKIALREAAENAVLEELKHETSDKGLTPIPSRFETFFRRGGEDYKSILIPGWYDAFMLFAADALKGSEPKFEKIFVATRLAGISEITSDTNEIALAIQSLSIAMSNSLKTNIGLLTSMNEKLDVSLSHFAQVDTRIISVGDDLKRLLPRPVWSERLKYWKIPNKAGLNSAIASPFADCFVTAALDGAITVWRLTSEMLDECLEIVKRSDVEATYAAFSSDGNHIVAAWYDGIVEVWTSAEPYKRIETFRHKMPVSTATFSPDCTQIITASQDGTVRIWSIRDYTSKCIYMKNGGESDITVNSAYFSPDGRSFVTACYEGGMLQIWDASSGILLNETLAHEHGVGSAEWSSDGTLIATTGTYDFKCRIWNTENLNLLFELNGHTDTVWTGSFSKDMSMVCTASADHSTVVWDMASRKIIKRLNHPSRVLTGMFTSFDKVILTACADNNAYLWKI